MAQPNFTPLHSIPDVVATLRKNFDSGHTRSAEWRLAQLRGIVRMAEENKQEICAALHKDLRQTDFLSNMAEVEGMIRTAEHAIENLSSWMAPSSRSLEMTQRPASGYTVREPLGVVLVIAPWNYPFTTLFKPVVGAIAAGNAVVLKPSEVSAACMECIAHLTERYLDRECITCVTGAVECSQTLLKQRFDHIFFTGNGNVAVSIMQAAALNLTPVTLELGGKSPCIVDSSANMDVACRRITWGKFLNAGQTCVAPDYVLVDNQVKQQFLDTLRRTIEEFFGPDPQKSKDFSRIINQRHTQRVLNYLKDQPAPTIGGQFDLADCYIAPTVVVEPRLDGELMKDEIFGPILPVVGVDNINQAISFINSRPKPLAMYMFSKHSANIDAVVSRTASGSLAINDTVLQITSYSMPFGGVGASGMGAQNGKYTFDTFSHEKTVLHRSDASWADLSVRYPPYTDSKMRMMKWITGKFPTRTVVLGLVLVAAAASFFVYRRYFA